MRTCWIVVGIGLALAATAVPSRAEDLTWCKRGSEAAMAQDYRTAADALTRCLETGHPPDRLLLAIYGSRGIAWLHLGEYERAVYDFSRVLQIKPTDAIAYLDRGLAWEKLGEHQMAADDFSQAIRLDPGKATPYLLRGIVWRHLGEYRKAIGDYDRVIEIKPDMAGAYNERGMAWQGLDEDLKAVDDYGRAIAIDPGLASAYGNRAIAWDKLGDYRKAIDDYSRLIELRPDDGTGYNGRAWARFRARTDLDAALADTETALRMEPDNWRYIDSRAEILASLGRPEEAMAAFERVMALTDADAIKRYETVLARQGYYTGPIDGLYGPSLRGALEACVRDACNAWSE